MRWQPFKPIVWALATCLTVVLGFNACTPQSNSSLGKQPVVTAQSAPEQVRYQQAARYSESYDGLAMVVARSGQVVFEAYARGVSPQRGNNLASGTKSFSCAIAALAVQDGLLTLDEPVAKTITEWQGDRQKSQLTIRQLLNLTSGITGGRLGDVPTYAEAINFPLTATPNTRFQYGPVPFQIFGEVMQRKFSARGMAESPLSYLEKRVLKPIGLRYDRWQRGKDKLPHLPSGAWISAREWVKYGMLILNNGQWQGQQLLDPQLLRECVQGSTINPAYGLTFWLNANGVLPTGDRHLQMPSVSSRTVMAIGAGNQVLFIIPEHNLVVVRQGQLNRRTLRQTQSGGFDRNQFLSLLLGQG